MGIKDQFKNNWLMIILVLLLFFIFIGGNLLSSVGSFKSFSTQEMAYDTSYQKASYYQPVQSDFAPQIKERKIVKTTRISTEVNRGTFKDSETKLKNIITSSESILLNENVNNYGSKKRSYYTGYYEIKVDTKKYDSVISQLKQIGNIKSFNGNMEDITGNYENINIELDAEKERLKRYQEMYKEAINIGDKITLNDKIFDQERRIKYLEDSLKNMDQRIDYSTIHFTMNEEQGYYNVVIVKFSELIRNLVSSFNGLLRFIFVIAPWLIALFVLWLIWRFFRR